MTSKIRFTDIAFGAGRSRTAPTTREASGRTNAAQKVAAGGILITLCVSLVACSSNSDQHAQGQPVVPSPSASGTVSATAPGGESLGNGVIGSGRRVKAQDGSTYETIALDANAPIYRFNNGQGLPSDLAAAGYTLADGQASQKLIADYMVNEFVDSTALETGSAGFQQWYSSTAKDYFTPSVYQQIGGNSNSIVVLGDAHSPAKPTMPKLIHDGKPREKSLNLSLTEVTPFSDAQWGNGIKYTVQYSADYRLSHADAADFAGKQSGMSADQFLASQYAKPSLKAGAGENLYRVTGDVSFVAAKDSGGGWKILGLLSNNNFDLSDFVQKN